MCEGYDTRILDVSAPISLLTLGIRRQEYHEVRRTSPWSEYSEARNPEEDRVGGVVFFNDHVHKPTRYLKNPHVLARSCSRASLHMYST